MNHAAFGNIRMMEASELERLLGMKEAVQLMGKAFASFSSGTSYVPQRTIASLPDKSMDLFMKPVYNEDLKRVAVKILTQKLGPAMEGIPTIIGIVLLIDAVTGEILSVMDGGWVTTLRTGAASGIATQYLARKDAETMALFGCGAQGYSQVEAVCSVRPVKRAFLYDLDEQAARNLKERIRTKLDISVSVEKNRAKLHEAEVICTATGSQEPLFERRDISPGVHINAIGSYKPHMQEIDPGILAASRLFVDSREAVLSESGDLMKPIHEGVIQGDFVKNEIGDLINGICEGRSSDQELTLFKSVGIAVQDLFVANAAYECILLNIP